VIRERGRIVRTQNERAWVEASSRLDCPRCQEGKGCGGGLLGRWLGDRLHEVQVRNPERIPEGSWVEMALDERRLMVAALMMYLPPLMTMLLGACIAQLGLKLGEPGVILWAVVGFFLGLGLSRYLAGLRRSLRYFTPVIRSRMPGPPSGCGRWAA